MATIATQLVSGQRRIITKVIGGQRRVSCSCCATVEADCCMYPAFAVISGAITFEDLPDEIIFEGGGFEATTFPKLDDPTVINTIGGEQGYLAYYGLNVGGGAVEDGLWNTVGIVGILGQWGVQIDFSLDPNFDCLISQGGPNPEQSIDPTLPVDNFEDIYTVTTTNPDNYFAPTVERQGLCEWYGDSVPGNRESDVLISYYDGIGPPPDVIGEPQHGWHIILGVPFAVRKNDPQNSPVGTYDVFGTIVTVSE